MDMYRIKPLVSISFIEYINDLTVASRYLNTHSICNTIKMLENPKTFITKLK